MNIKNIYRKIIEKAGEWKPKGLDHFLFFSALVLLTVFIFVNIFLIRADKAARTELPVSRRCVELFGAETMDALIREFEEKHHGLRVKLVSDSGGAYTDVEKAAAPKVIFFDEGQFGGLVQKDALAPIELFLQDDSVSADRTAPRYAIPLVSFMDLLAYNIEILQKAGFDRPPKTRAEFLNLARAAAKLAGDTRYATAIGLDADDPFAMKRDIYSWIWAAGTDIPQPADDGKQPEFSRTAEEILAFFGQLHREGLLAPGSFQTTGAERLEEFAVGKIAMMTISTRDLPALRKKMKDLNLGVTVIPAGLNSPLKNRSCLSAVYAGISVSSTLQSSPLENALSFIIFLAEKSYVLSAKLNASPGLLPNGIADGISVPVAFSGGYLEEDPLYAKVRGIFDASSFVEDFSGSPRQPEIDAIVREKLAALMPDRDIN